MTDTSPALRTTAQGLGGGGSGCSRGGVGAPAASREGGDRAYEEGGAVADAAPPTPVKDDEGWGDDDWGDDGDIGSTT